MRCFRVLIACAFVLIFRAALAAPNFEFRGEWHIDRIVGTTDITTDERLQKRLIGKRILIDRNSITIGSYRCEADKVIPAADIPTADLLFYYYRTHPESSGVPTRTDVLDMGLCNDVFRDGKRIIVVYEGAFYEASRVKNNR